MKPRTRRGSIGSGAAGTAPARVSSELYVHCLALHRWCHMTELAALDGISKAVAWLHATASTQAVKARAMKPRTRRGSIGSGSAGTAPARVSSELYVHCLALHRWCHITELAALDGISKAVAWLHATASTQAVKARAITGRCSRVPDEIASAQGRPAPPRHVSVAICTCIASRCIAGVI